MLGYPSRPTNPDLLYKKGRIRNCTVPDYTPLEMGGGLTQEVRLVNKWLLTPAAIGTAAYYLMYLLFRDTKKSSKKQKSRVGPGVIVYTGITTVAITFYLYNVLITLDGSLIDAYFPVVGAIMLIILYYASVYTWIYLLDPNSFNAETGDDVISEIITFLYFSTTNFITAGGDIAPISNTARIVVSLQVLCFELSLTLGLMFFVATS